MTAAALHADFLFFSGALYPFPPFQRPEHPFCSPGWLKQGKDAPAILLLVLWTIDRTSQDLPPPMLVLPMHTSLGSLPIGDTSAPLPSLPTIRQPSFPTERKGPQKPLFFPVPNFPLWEGPPAWSLNFIGSGSPWVPFPWRRRNFHSRSGPKPPPNRKSPPPISLFVALHEDGDRYRVSLSDLLLSGLSSLALAPMIEQHSPDPPLRPYKGPCAFFRYFPRYLSGLPCRPRPPAADLLISRVTPPLKCLPHSSFFFWLFSDYPALYSSLFFTQEL